MKKVTVIEAEDIVGDQFAPRGSLDWAKWKRTFLADLLHNQEMNKVLIQQVSDDLTDTEAWKLLKDQNGKPFKKFSDFCAAPNPYGLGYSLAVLQELIREGREESARARTQHAAEATTGEVLPGNGYVAERKEGSQITNPASQAERAKENGVSKRTQEKLDALAREAPEELDKVKAGELSVHGACIEAGIVKKPTPLDNLRKWWNKASVEEQETFRKEIKGG